MAFDMMENVGAGTPDISWIDKLKGFSTSASESLQKDPGMWSTLLGELAPLVAPDNPLIVGAGKIGSQFGKAKTLMTAEQAKAAKDEEFKKSILAALSAGHTPAGQTGLNKISYKSDGLGGRVADISLDLEDSPGIDPTTGQAGTIANNTGGISLDQGPTMESLSTPGIGQPKRKGFDIRPFF